MKPIELALAFYLFVPLSIALAIPRVTRWAAVGLFGGYLLTLGVGYLHGVSVGEPHRVASGLAIVDFSGATREPCEHLDLVQAITQTISLSFEVVTVLQVQPELL